MKARAPKLCDKLGGVWGNNCILNKNRKKLIFLKKIKLKIDSTDDADEWPIDNEDESLCILNEENGAVGVVQDGLDEQLSDLFALEVAFVEDVAADEFLLLLRDVYGGNVGIANQREVQREKLIGQLRAAALYSCSNVVRQCVTALLDNSIGGVMVSTLTDHPLILLFDDKVFCLFVCCFFFSVDTDQFSVCVAHGARIEFATLGAVLSRHDFV